MNGESPDYGPIFLGLEVINLFLFLTANDDKYFMYVNPIV